MADPPENAAEQVLELRAHLPDDLWKAAGEWLEWGDDEGSLMVRCENAVLVWKNDLAWYDEELPDGHRRARCYRDKEKVGGGTTHLDDRRADPSQN